MARNPFTDNRQKSQRHSDDFALDIARVKRVDDDDTHQVVVEIVSSSAEGPQKVPAVVPADGDIALPREDEMVVVGYARGDKPIVLGTIYSRQTAPSDYTAGERLISEGDASVKLTEAGAVEVTTASGESFTINGVPIEVPIDNPLSFPHAEWTTANNQNEIWRVELQSDETLKVYRLETSYKGGGTDPDFTIDLYDVDDGRVIASTSSVAQGEPIGESGQGHTVIARITNDTGSTQIVSVNSKITIERER